jgi:hypothetical protein
MLDHIIETPTPSVGLVIGSYGVPAYMHLQLVSWKRFYPTIPLLIHDDSSDASDQIAELCKAYGASFCKTEKREGHLEGDLSASIRGLEFGRNNGLDLMVKFSRTWIPINNFVPSLQRLAHETQYATYGNQCKSNGYRLRTECIGWHIPTYFEGGHLDDMREWLRRRCQAGDYMELFLHRVAKKVIEKSTCTANAEYRARDSLYHKWRYYGIWDWMSEDSQKPNGNWLWHRSDKPLDYHRLSQIYDLPYALEDFENRPY